MKAPSLVALAAVLWLAGCSPLASPVVLGPADLALLTGSWRGTFERRARLRTLEFETPVMLRVSEGKPPRGTFTLGTGMTWRTSVEVRERSVVMGFDQAMREFVFVRGAGGSLRLEAAYDALVEGWPVSVRVVLEKE